MALPYVRMRISRVWGHFRQKYFLCPLQSSNLHHILTFNTISHHFNAIEKSKSVSCDSHLVSFLNPKLAWPCIPSVQCLFSGRLDFPGQSMSSAWSFYPALGVGLSVMVNNLLTTCPISCHEILKAYLRVLTGRNSSSSQWVKHWYIRRWA